MSSTSEISEMWKDRRQAIKQEKEDRLKQADLTGWTKHTDYHYSRLVCSRRMDYWPSTGLVMYKGKRHNINSKFVRDKLATGAE